MRRVDNINFKWDNVPRTRWCYITPSCTVMYIPVGIPGIAWKIIFTTTTQESSSYAKPFLVQRTHTHTCFTLFIYKNIVVIVIIFWYNNKYYYVWQNVFCYDSTTANYGKSILKSSKSQKTW